MVLAKVKLCFTLIVYLDYVQNFDIQDLYKQYIEAPGEGPKYLVIRRSMKDNATEYQIHVKRLKDVNGFKAHNILRSKDSDTNVNETVYINNPVESQIPNAFLTFEEFKKTLLARVEKDREELRKKKLRNMIYEIWKNKKKITQITHKNRTHQVNDNYSKQAQRVNDKAKSSITISHTQNNTDQEKVKIGKGTSDDQDGINKIWNNKINMTPITHKNRTHRVNDNYSNQVQRVDDKAKSSITISHTKNNTAQEKVIIGKGTSDDQDGINKIWNNKINMTPITHKNRTHQVNDNSKEAQHIDHILTTSIKSSHTNNSTAKGQVKIGKGTSDDQKLRSTVNKTVVILESNAGNIIAKANDDITESKTTEDKGHIRNNGLVTDHQDLVPTETDKTKVTLLSIAEKVVLKPSEDATPTPIDQITKNEEKVIESTALGTLELTADMKTTTESVSKYLGVATYASTEDSVISDVTENSVTLEMNGTTTAVETATTIEPQSYEYNSEEETEEPTTVTTAKVTFGRPRVFMGG